MRFAALFLLASALLTPTRQASAIGIPAGTQLEIVADASYLPPGMPEQLTQPVSVALTVLQVAGVTVEQGLLPDPIVAGQANYVPLRIHNVGNGVDTFSISITSSSGWTASLVYDSNADGIHQSSEITTITSTGSMVADGYCPCFAKIVVPSSASTSAVFTVRATSALDAVRGTGLSSFNLNPPATLPVDISVPTRNTTYRTGRATVGLGGTARNTAGVTRVEWSNDRGGSGVCVGTTVWSAAGIQLQQGSNLITVTAHNGSVVFGSDSLTVIYTPDTQPPTLQIVFPTSQPRCARNTSLLRIAGTAGDDIGLVSVEWSSDPLGDFGQCTLDGQFWSAEGIQLTAGGNLITVTAQDSGGNYAVATVEVEYIDSSPGDAWIGKAMVSLPVIPDETDPKQVCNFYANSWCCYSTAQNSYAVYPSTATWFQPPALTPGRGFWASFDGPPETPCGTIPAQDQLAVIRLRPGWNLIGTPFIRDVVWDTSAIMVYEPGKSPKPLVSAHYLLPGYAWGWRQNPDDPYTGAYYLIYDSALMPGVDDRLEPWRAYWIKATRDCYLMLPPPQGAS